MKKIGKTKRLLSLFLAVMMLLSIVPAFSVTSKAANFTPRTTAPSYSDRYWINTAYGGLNECILISGNSCLPNCVGYAWGRAYEILGSRPRLAKTNANTWYNYTADGYARGSTPKVGSIVCWNFGQYGHVAVVEKVYSNTSIDISESSYNGARFKYLNINPYTANPGLQGYIYLGDFNDSQFGNSVNIGDDFYASIIKNDGWVPIAPVDGKVQAVKGTGDASEFWHFVRQSDNSYVIYNCKSGKVLDVTGAQTADGTQIQEYQYWGNPAQQWFIYGRWSGEYVLKPKLCDKVLDLNNNGNAPGTKVQLWSYNQSNAQKFAIYKFDKVSPSSLSVTPGTSVSKTTIKWTKAANASKYNLRIRKGTPGNVKSYKDIWNLKDTSYELVLSEGYYEVYVDSCAAYHYATSNTVSFNINHTHSYTAKITQEATCATTGIKIYTCSTCGVKKTNTIAKNPKNHAGGTGVKNSYLPTCTTPGYDGDKYCLGCGEIIERGNEIAAKGHSKVTVLNKAATSKSGSRIVKCITCDEILNTVTIPQIKTVKLSKRILAYTGKTLTPKVTVKDTEGKTLELGKDYTVEYRNNRKIGKATAVVTFKGDYEGTVTLSFKIVPPTPTVKVTAGKKKATVKWNAVKGATSYTVYYSKSKNSGFKKVGVTTGKTFTVKKLKSGSNRYFKVVANRKVGGKIYSSYSSTVKKARIK